MTSSTNAVMQRFLKRSTPLIVFLALMTTHVATQAAEPKTIRGLKNPTSVAVGTSGKIYVTLIGGRDVEKDGSIVIVDEKGKITPFAIGLDDPKGLIIVGDFLYVTDLKKVWKINARGKTEVFVAPEAFPRPPLYLNDIAFDGLGNFYVSDSGNRVGQKGAVFRIDARRQVTQVLDGELTSPAIDVPSGLLMDDPDHIFVADFGQGYLYRYDLITGTPQRMGGGFGGTNAIARDRAGSLYVGDWTNGRLYLIESDLEPPTLISDRFRSVVDMAFTGDGRFLLVLDMKAGTLTWFPVP
jgi:gluconolactonase